MDRLLRTDPSSGMLMCHLSVLSSCHFPQHFVEWRKHQHQMRENRRGQDVKSRKGYQMIPTGSRQECLSVASLPDTTTSKFLDNVSDSDFMLVTPCCKVGISRTDNEHLVIDTSATKPGYLRLEHQMGVECPYMPKIGRRVKVRGATKLYFTYDRYKQIWRYCSVKVMCKQKSLVSVESYIQGPAVVTKEVRSDSGSYGRVQFDQDLALALRCEHWPQAANEWLTRPRLYGWPAPDLIQHITQKGCHLVSTAHPQSDNASIEWRFSFTVAEKALAFSLTRAQRSSFILFKTILSYLLQPHSVVSSYCLKNILFWKLEQIPKSVWDNGFVGIGIGVSELLDELIHCLAERNLPQYFIRENNLIGSKPREQITSVLRTLIKFRDQLFVPFFIFQEGKPGVLKNVHLNNHVGRHFVLDSMLFIRTSPQVVQSILQETRLLQSAKDREAHGFAEVVADILRLVPSLLSSYERDLRFLPGRIQQGTPEKDRYAFGFAWCMFVYNSTQHTTVANYQFKVELMELMFKLAMDWCTSVADLALMQFCHAVYLQCTDHVSESLEILTKMLPKFEELFRSNPAKTSMVLSHFETGAMDEVIQKVLVLPTYCCFHIKSLVYHFLIHGYSRVDDVTKIPELITMYIEHSKKIQNDPYSFSAAAHINGLNLLAHDLEHFGYKDEAKEMSEAHLDVVQGHDMMNTIDELVKQTLENTAAD